MLYFYEISSLLFPEIITILYYNILYWKSLFKYCLCCSIFREIYLFVFSHSGNVNKDPRNFFLVEIYLIALYRLQMLRIIRIPGSKFTINILFEKKNPQLLVTNTYFVHDIVAILII